MLRLQEKRDGMKLTPAPGYMRRIYLLTIWLVTVALFVSFQHPAEVSAQQDGPKGEKYVTIDFNDVDINLFIKYISELTGKNFIVDRTVKGKITIIRPLCYVEEKLIIKFAREKGFPEQICRCPFGMDSKRKHVKEFIRETEKNTPRTNVKTNILKSISRIKKDYLDFRQ